jgi:hypothetical protein
MKKFFNKIKSGLTTFWIALMYFPFRVKGQERWKWVNPEAQPDYWIYYPSEKILWPSSTERTMMIIEKIIPRLLVTVIFIVWIVSFIKIRKIDDKTLKKKKIKNTIIIITILVILTIIFTTAVPFLKKYIVW